jgi:hypothetical protein
MDVFVDNFIQLGQGGPRCLKALRGHLLRAINQVLAQLTAKETHRNEAILLKKLLKGDGSWNTQKLILGWIVNTIHHTIELPPHCKEMIASIFEKLASLKRVNSKKWVSYLGKLCFVLVAILGSASLFSAMQWAQNKAKGNLIHFSQWQESQKTLVLNLRRNHVAGKVTNIAIKQQGYNSSRTTD